MFVVSDKYIYVAWNVSQFYCIQYSTSPELIPPSAAGKLEDFNVRKNLEKIQKNFNNNRSRSPGGILLSATKTVLAGQRTA